MSSLYTAYYPAPLFQIITATPSTHCPLPVLYKDFHNLQNTLILKTATEDSACLNVRKPSTFYMAYPQKLKSYIKLALADNKVLHCKILKLWCSLILKYIKIKCKNTYLVDPMLQADSASVVCFPWGTAVLCYKTSCLVQSVALWDPIAQLETHIITTEPLKKTCTQWTNNWENFSLYRYTWDPRETIILLFTDYSEIWYKCM